MNDKFYTIPKDDLGKKKWLRDTIDEMRRFQKTLNIPDEIIAGLEKHYTVYVETLDVIEKYTKLKNELIGVIEKIANETTHETFSRPNNNPPEDNHK